MRRKTCYDHNTMAKIRLWDTKNTKTEVESRPNSPAPAQSVGQTVTTEDYYNSPLARKSSSSRQTNKQIEGLKIGSPFAPSPQIPASSEQNSSLSEDNFEKVEKFRVLKKRQRRRQAMSVSVSEEEEQMLREGAAAEGMTFSAWARKHLFRAMKAKIPTRPIR